MKIILRIVLCLVLLSCSNKHKNKPAWLIGNWVRTNTKPDKYTYEFWGEDFKGLGFTLKQNDTIFKEDLKISMINDSLYLEVSGVNEYPTRFKFTTQTDTSFVAENPKNEFPKKITYWITNDFLNARVGNKDMFIDFTFEKLPY